ncbi:8331_t:CDS:1, partial [Gigaspora margarita]
FSINFATHQTQSAANRELIRVVMEIKSGQRRGAPPLRFN